MPDLFENSQYAARPSEAERAQRLAVLGLTPDDITAPPIVVQRGQTFEFTPDNPAAKLWLKPMPTPQSLEHLKEMVGVPNRVFESSDSKFMAVHPEVANKPLGDADAFSLMSQDSDAHKVAMNLVYGYADPSYTAQSSVQQLTKIMCAALEGQYAVVGSDLVVQAGAKVDLGPNPSVNFDRIIVHGDGQIICHSNQKVSANVVQWLAS